MNERDRQREVVQGVEDKLIAKLASWKKCYPNSVSDTNGLSFYGEITVGEIKMLLELIEESEILVP